jgi:hypothetical protein
VACRWKGVGIVVSSDWAVNECVLLVMCWVTMADYCFEIEVTRDMCISSS